MLRPILAQHQIELKITSVIEHNEASPHNAIGLMFITQRTEYYMSFVEKGISLWLLRDVIKRILYACHHKSLLLILKYIFIHHNMTHVMNIMRMWFLHVAHDCGGKHVNSANNLCVCEAHIKFSVISANVLHWLQIWRIDMWCVVGDIRFNIYIYIGRSVAQTRWKMFAAVASDCARLHYYIICMYRCHAFK